MKQLIKKLLQLLKWRRNQADSIIETKSEPNTEDGSTDIANNINCKYLSSEYKEGTMYYCKLMSGTNTAYLNIAKKYMQAFNRPMVPNGECVWAYNCKQTECPYYQSEQ